jgi:integrating conjugative element protein (TIGR03759 family)
MRQGGVPMRAEALIALVSLASLPGTVAAERATTQTQETRLEQTRLAETERRRAAEWQLDEREWQRYESLMAGVRGSVSPSTLSPVEVLGIHARDDAERQRYAERWARLMHEDAERVLAFERAYRAAFARLYPAEFLIDPARLSAASQSPAAGADSSADERLLFFTRVGCERCDALLARLVARLDPRQGLDIYLLGVTEGDDAAIRDWARERALSAAWVRSRKVTLNHDGGALARVTRGAGAVPLLLRRRGDTLTRVALEGL